ncbi:MAG: hypothetical protein KIH69_004305 [Anaerolineae bacterium]|nr:hypothetical protein [Anaerolineae bacterium]
MKVQIVLNTKRAKKSDRAKYLRVLAKVPDGDSAGLDLPESDQLPAQYARHRLNQPQTAVTLAESPCLNKESA